MAAAVSVRLNRVPRRSNSFVFEVHLYPRVRNVPCIEPFGPIVIKDVPGMTPFFAATRDLYNPGRMWILTGFFGHFMDYTFKWISREFYLLNFIIYDCFFWFETCKVPLYVNCRLNNIMS
ncbi:hypothetical protein TVAG_394700 [Trichomonas vaginalis G3]|uniref:Uncharacterized protein n=1 Tax=Trichomonas vaginalis (strain ATCC PRA-98 / G3) TaxID=412133 RepID=A2EDD4_TRIV3|nr:hypothetical protein TVAGG3_0725640 [Trichomonas vaginalis G3]EAY09298.1 hypothetical protein TVAG_394700 [Trichomonas vaginalis G3]KAI5510886.1 hypothetical protein TVAGG3_0725640 [Trichomonas vaginalis G3]|eukprot:XP_001321521.1 hypothetical protein [Trichomonas vaginalis G3]